MTTREELLALADDIERVRLNEGRIYELTNYEAGVIVAGLRAAAQDDGWQPIESAPKDGTWVELWRAPPTEDDAGRWTPRVVARWYAWDPTDASWAWPNDDRPLNVWTTAGIAEANAAIESGDYFEDIKFTHWRPLPSPPRDRKPMESGE